LRLGSQAREFSQKVAPRMPLANRHRSAHMSFRQSSVLCSSQEQSQPHACTTFLGGVVVVAGVVVGGSVVTTWAMQVPEGFAWRHM